MVYVPPGKKLSDPLKSYRLLYICEPFLEDFRPTARGKYTKSTLEKILHTNFCETQNKKKVGALEFYRIYHAKLRERLGELRGQRAIFIPGISADQGEYVRYVGQDLYSERFKLSDKLLALAQELRDEADLEGLLIFPIAPIALPARLETNSVQLVFPFQDMWNEVNASLPKYKRVQIKVLKKPAAGTFGFYEFSDLLFDLAGAKKVFGGNGQLEYHCYLNRQIVAAMWDSIFKLLGVNEPPIYAKKSSYVWEILKFSKFQPKRIGGERGPMRNADISKLGECEPSALNILKGYLVTWKSATV